MRKKTITHLEALRELLNDPLDPEYKGTLEKRLQAQEMAKNRNLIPACILELQDMIEALNKKQPKTQQVVAK